MTDDHGVHEERVENEQPTGGMAPLHTLDGQTIYELPYRREGDTVHFGWNVPTELAEVRAAAERAAARDLYSRMELGKTQQTLAASQADLTRAEVERDELKARSVLLADIALERRRQRNNAWRERDLANAELERERQESGRLRRETERLAALLEHAEQHARDLQDNGDVAPGWQVAAVMTDIHCERCGGPLMRGHAYRPTSGDSTTKGRFAHVFCPPLTESWVTTPEDLTWRCSACGQQLLRGQAFKPSGPGAHEHIYCPPA
jgi:hypothetical protein